MNYIVEPSFFYWLSVLHNVSCCITVLAILSVVGMILTISLWGYMRSEYGADDNDTLFWKKGFKISLIVFLSTLPFVIFIPSKETLIAMKVAECATYENIEIAQNEVKETIDYIFDKVDEVKDKDKE